MLLLSGLPLSIELLMESRHPNSSKCSKPQRGPPKHNGEEIWAKLEKKKTNGGGE